MKHMYALRGQKFFGDRTGSGKADGAFIRDWDRVTDNKSSAKLFESKDDALEYYSAWALRAGPGLTNYPVWIVMVEVKPVMKSVIVCLNPDQPLDQRKF